MGCVSEVKEQAVGHPASEGEEGLGLGLAFFSTQNGRHTPPTPHISPHLCELDLQDVCVVGHSCAHHPKQQRDVDREGNEVVVLALALVGGGLKQDILSR